jgi:hypothetical protein
MANCLTQFCQNCGIYVGVMYLRGVEDSVQ